MNRLKRTMNRTKTGETLLIDEKLFRLYSVVSLHTPLDKCYPFLELAQNFYIEPILGTALLTELQLQIENDNLTDENKALIIKIAPALSAWTDYLAARSLAYSTTAKGVSKESSENSEPLNDKEMSFYIHNLRETANQSQEVLLKYLCRCADAYELWRPEKECECNKFMPTEGTADPEWKKLIYFPSGKRSKCPKCDRG